MGWRDQAGKSVFETAGTKRNQNSKYAYYRQDHGELRARRLDRNWPIFSKGHDFVGCECESSYKAFQERRDVI